MPERPEPRVTLLALAVVLAMGPHAALNAAPAPRPADVAGEVRFIVRVASESDARDGISAAWNLERGNTVAPLQSAPDLVALTRAWCPNNRLTYWDEAGRWLVRNVRTPKGADRKLDGAARRASLDLRRIQVDLDRAGRYAFLAAGESLDSPPADLLAEVRSRAEWTAVLDLTARAMTALWRAQPEDFGRAFSVLLWQRVQCEFELKNREFIAGKLEAAGDMPDPRTAGALALLSGGNVGESPGAHPAP
jgi:hypothetical protein